MPFPRSRRIASLGRLALAAGVLGLGAFRPAVGASAAAVAPPTVADFARRPDFSQVSLSPDGQYIAAVVRDGDNPILAVLKTADRSRVASLNMKGLDRGIGAYAWDGPSRLVISLSRDNEFYGEIHYTGELMAFDVETSFATYLLGFRADDFKATMGGVSDTRLTGWGRVLDATPETPGSVVAVVGGWADNTRPRVVSLDTRTGRTALIAASPGDADVGVDFMTDQHGVLRYATIGDMASTREYRVFRRTADQANWVEIPDLSRQNVDPLWLSRDGTWAYFTSDNGQLPARFCLRRQHADGSGPLEQIVCQDDAAMLRTIESRDGNALIGVYSEPGAPSLKLVSDDADAELLANLQTSLGDGLVEPVSATLDGRLWLLEVASDRNPGTYYLYHHDTRQVEELFQAYEGLSLEGMRPARPVRYAARDGVVIHGFLTLPAPTADGRKPPLVVLPHGGPVGPRDDWFYDAETQLLATHGFAVLRVNFRGSGGYGRAFRQAAKQQWGKALIDDITDGARHVIKEGLVDGDRVGIFGASYGGYAALMSGVREPELYKAVVTYAGVSDLVRQTQDSDTAESDQGLLYMGKYIGSNDAELQAQSPLTYIDKLRAPVLIVHGMDDKRVPYSQAKLLRAALDERHHPYEWFVRADEGHGFSRTVNRRAFNETLLAFLDKHLKSRPAA